MSLDLTEPSSLNTRETNNEPLQWFAARTRHGQELSARDKLYNNRLDTFVPTRMGYRSHAGSRRLVEKPVINNLIFVRGTKSRVCEVANGLGTVFLMMDNVRRGLLVVPDKQMDDFRRVMDLDPNAIQEEQLALAPGHKVRVIKGSFAGVEGEILENGGKTYVIVSLMDLMHAKVEIPKAYLEKIA